MLSTKIVGILLTLFSIALVGLTIYMLISGPGELYPNHPNYMYNSDGTISRYVLTLMVLTCGFAISSEYMVLKVLHREDQLLANQPPPIENTIP